MNNLIVRLGSFDDTSRRLAEADQREREGMPHPEAAAAVEFASYEQMHRVLAPARLTIVKTLAGQGSLSIREVARRVGRDIQAVHRDVTTLINAGVIDRTEAGVEFPYDTLHFEFDVRTDAA